MNSFKKLIQAQQDCETLYNSLMQSHNILKEITAASIERINKEKEETQSRIYELSEQIDDSNRSAVVRNIAEAERMKLQNKIFFVTPEELAAFDREYDTAACALSDARKIVSDFLKYIKEVEAELATIKTERGKRAEHIELAEKWLVSAKCEFDRLKG